MQQVPISRVVDCEQQAEDLRAVAPRASDEIGEGGEVCGPVVDERRWRKTRKEEVGGGGEAGDRREEQEQGDEGDGDDREQVPLGRGGCRH